MPVTLTFSGHHLVLSAGVIEETLDYPDGGLTPDQAVLFADAVRRMAGAPGAEDPSPASEKTARRTERAIDRPESIRTPERTTERAPEPESKRAARKH